MTPNLLIAQKNLKSPTFSDGFQREMERPTSWGEPTEVQIGVYVLDVDEVNSAEQNFTESVYYEVRWKNPLLKHKGPGPLQRRITDVWNPRIAIVSLQMSRTAFPEYVQIEPDGTVIYRQIG